MKNSILYKIIFVMPMLLIFYCSLNCAINLVPLSCGALVGFLYSGLPVLGVLVTFMASFLVYKSLDMILVGAFFGVIISLIFLLYRRKKRRPGAEIILYTFFALLPYLLHNFNSFAIKKLVYMSIIVLFSFSATTGIDALVNQKNLTIKSRGEVFSLTAVFLFFAVGFVNLFGVSVYKPLAILALLLLCRYLKSPTAALYSLILATPPAITQQNPIYFAIFAIYFAALSLCWGTPSPIIGIVAAFTEVLLTFVLGFYQSASYLECLPTLILLFAQSLVPQSVITRLKEKLSLKPSEILTREVITKQRSSVSAKLYDLSNVFFSMQDAFNNLKKCTESTDGIIDKMTAEVLYSMCANCSFSSRCIKKAALKRDVIDKIIRIGVAKGRITLIDLPRDFLDVCAYPNSVIFEVNRLIGAYFEILKEAESGDKSKEILSLQSGGVGGVLKAIGFSLSKTMPENKQLERLILSTLFKRGAKCEAALVFGEDSDVEINLLVSKKTFDDFDILSILNEALEDKLSLTKAQTVANGLVYLTLTKAPKLDAAFGISKVTKSLSTASGDCHSLIKIDESNFLVALSDGMGSGETAFKTSETALNLIESLYRAGLDSEFVLTLVNKLLSITIDDNFSAIDIALINLNSGSAGFIKIGSPYGFILSNNGIRFIEGSSLPIGILDDLHPTTCSCELSDGDVIVMVSDGVTDAFGSTGDFIDFLKGAPLYNPQELSDTILSRALTLSGNTADDDMSALCVRFFKSA